MAGAKKVKKKIKVGDYLKKAEYANKLSPNKYDVMMAADGYFLFKNWGKGKILWTLHYGTWVTGGSLNKEFKYGIKLISLEFDDKKTNYFLKADIIETLKEFQKKGGWTSGTFKKKKRLEPKDIENLKITVESKYW